jgi:CubicO group peptidase (beta-lactamase class C family)
MMRLLVLAAAVAMAACAGNAPADDAPGDDGDDDCAALAPAIEDDFAAELAAAVEANTGQGGGILRIECRGGGVMWEGAAGDVAEAGGVALRADDAFEIQSTTKAFTAALALTFVEDGSIGLDDPVGSVLPAADTDGLLVIGGHDYGARADAAPVARAHRRAAGLLERWPVRLRRAQRLPARLPRRSRARVRAARADRLREAARADRAARRRPSL